MPSCNTYHLTWVSLTLGAVPDFIFLGSKITTDGDCSHEIKRRLLLGRKVMTNLDSTFKSRDITLPIKGRLVKVMVFPIVMYGCESWTIKKVECQRTDAFELWCWRRLLRVPWTARKSNQSILKEDSLPTEPPQKPKNTGVGGLSLLQQIFPRNQTGLSCIAGGFFTS